VADQPNNLTASFDTLGDRVPFDGYDEKILAGEGLINDGGSLNIPYLVGVMSSTGNAMTEAIGRNAMVFGDLPWQDDGGDGDGEGGSGGGVGSMSSQSGGLIVEW